MRSALRKMLVVRIFMRNKEVFGSSDHAMDAIMQKAGTNPDEIQSIYRLTAIPTFEERFVYSPYHREQNISAVKDPLAHKGEAGLGFLSPPRRHA